MNKATRTLIAAAAALAMSGGVYAQTAGGMNGGGSSNGTMTNPAANQMNDTSSGYGAPGSSNSDSGMPVGQSKSGMRDGTSNSAPRHTSAPPDNNSLARPTVKSPAAAQ